MNGVLKKMIRHIFFMIGLLLLQDVLAQNAFTINGRLKIDGGSMDGARLVVYKNGKKDRTIANGLNKFSLDLEIGQNYILSFEKDGFVSKKLSFNTKVPAEVTAKPFTPFDFAVSLFKQYDDLNLVVFNQPVGVIRYEPSMGDFDYDTDYTKSIQTQLQQALAAVEQRQKEEEKNAGAEAKRKAAEEKAAAKAAADAKALEQKEIEAKKAAEAQQKAEEQARAKALEQEAEKKKKEAEVARVPVKKEQPRSEPVAKEVAKPEPKKIADPLPVQKAAPPKPVERVRSVVKSPSTTNAVTAKATTGEEQRRTTRPVIAMEKEPVTKNEPPEASEAERHEELLEEPGKVTKIVRLVRGGQITEYRKVVHKWGGVFYFKNGNTCSQLVYDAEAMNGEQVAGATPRPKHGR